MKGISKHTMSRFEALSAVEFLGKDAVLKALVAMMERKEGFSQMVIDYAIHNDLANDYDVNVRRNIIAGKADYLEVEG